MSQLSTTPTPRRVSRRNRGGNAQSMVEFALTVSIALPVTLAIVSFAWLAFVEGQLDSAARAAARKASLETVTAAQLNPSSGTQTQFGLWYQDTAGAKRCESGYPYASSPAPEDTPVYVYQEAQTEAFFITVNPVRLCDYNGTAKTSDTLTQGATVANEVNITVNGYDSGVSNLETPTEVKATVTYTVTGIAPPFNLSKTLTISSEQPVWEPWQVDAPGS